MEFISEKERKQHHLASKLPRPIWRHFFHNHLTPSELSLLKCLPKKCYYSKLWYENSYTLFLCLFYAHPQITAEQFITIFKDKRFFNVAKIVALIVGRIDVLQIISQKERRNITRTIELDDFSLLFTAGQYSSPKTIKALINLYQGNIRNILRAKNYILFNWACERGHVSLFDYLLSLAPDINDEMISYGNYQVFRTTAFKGKTGILKRLFNTIPTSRIPFILALDNYGVFSKAASCKQLAPLMYLLSLEPEQKMNIINWDNYKVIREAAGYRRFNTIKYLFHLLPIDPLNFLAANEFDLFSSAAHSGSLRVLNFYIKLAPTQVDEMIQANSFRAFRKAAKYGHIHVMRRLVTLKPEWKNNMMRSQNYEAFREAASSGDMKVLRFITNTLPEEAPLMVCAENCYAFRKANIYKRIDVLNYLISLYPKGVRWMIAANSYEIFAQAVNWNNFSVMKRLVSLAPDLVPNMLAANNYKALRNAIYYGSFKLTMIKYLLYLAGNKAQEILFSNDYAAFETTNVPAINYLLGLFPKDKERIAQTIQYRLFYNAVLQSRFDLLNYSLKLIPADLQTMIATNEYAVFRAASSANQDTEMLRYLIKKIAPEKKHEMICAYSLSAFKCAIQYHQPLSPKLLYLFDVASENTEEIISSNNFELLHKAIQEKNLTILKFFYSKLPSQINHLLNKDNELIKQAISANQLNCLEFLLAHCDDLATKTIFMYPEKTWVSSFDDSFSALYNAFTLHTLFENPINWDMEKRHNLLCSCLQQGYFSIAKCCMVQFWHQQNSFYQSLFFSELFLYVRSFPKETADLLGFLMDKMNISIQEMDQKIRKIPQDELSPLFFHVYTMAKNNITG